MKRNLLICSTIFVFGVEIMTIQAFPQFTRDDESYEDTSDIGDISDIFDEEVLSVTKLKPKEAPVWFGNIPTTSTTTEKPKTSTERVTTVQNLPQKVQAQEINLGNVAPNVASGNVYTFTINIPYGMDGTSGGTIKFNIGKETVSQVQETNPGQALPVAPSQAMMPVSISAPDDQSAQNIENAILEALSIAKYMTGSNMSTNGTNDLDFELPANLNISKIASVASTNKGQQAKPAMETFSQSSNPLPPLSPTDIFMSQIRNGNLQQMLLKNLPKLPGLVITAIEDVECALFDFCDGIDLPFL